MKKNDSLIIILALNEEKNIGRLLEKLFIEHKTADILLVNDGSIDKTAVCASKYNVTVLSHPFNIGIGASFQTGCLYALSHGYENIVRIDGDGQHDPKHIVNILSPIKKGEVDIVVGSRFLETSSFKSSFMRRIGISVISTTLALITKKKFTDPTSGFCAMNKRAYSFFAEKCAEDYPEPEVFLHHLNFKIKEVPVSMIKRTEGSSSIRNIKTLYFMYKVLFSIFLSTFRKE